MSPRFSSQISLLVIAVFSFWLAFAPDGAQPGIMAQSAEPTPLPLEMETPTTGNALPLFRSPLPEPVASPDEPAPVEVVAPMPEVPVLMPGLFQSPPSTPNSLYVPNYPAGTTYTGPMTTTWIVPWSAAYPSCSGGGNCTISAAQIYPRVMSPYALELWLIPNATYGTATPSGVFQTPMTGQGASVRTAGFAHSQYQLQGCTLNVMGFHHTLQSNVTLQGGTAQTVIQKATNPVFENWLGQATTFTTYQSKTLGPQVQTVTDYGSVRIPASGYYYVFADATTTDIYVGGGRIALYLDGMDKTTLSGTSNPSTTGQFIYMEQGGHNLAVKAVTPACSSYDYYCERRGHTSWYRGLVILPAFPDLSGNTCANVANQFRALPNDQAWSPEECPTCSNTEARNYVGGPIDTFSGNYNYQTIDISLPTPGQPLVFERAYNSQAVSRDTAPFSPGWTHSYEIGLILPADPGGESGTVIFKGAHGSRMRFADKGNNTFEAYPGVWATLTKNGQTYTVTTARQTVYNFGVPGGSTHPKLLSVRDEHGNITTLAYSADRLSRVTGPGGGRWLNFSYQNNRLSSVTDHTGRAVTFSYNSAGDLTGVTDLRGKTWTYTYTGNHLLQAVVDPDGKTVERTFYDGQARANRQENGLNRPVIQIEYPDALIRRVTEYGQTGVDVYDARGLLTGQVDSQNRAYSFRFDSQFNRKGITDANGQATALTRNNFGQTTRLINALSQTGIFTYNTLNLLTETRDPLNRLTRYSYDGTGNLTRIDNALNGNRGYSYNGQGQITSVTDENGRVTRFGYDGAGNLITITNPLNQITTLAYDAPGRIIRQTAANNQITLYEYDNGDNLLKLTENYLSGQAQNYQNVYNRITQYAYDNAGRQLIVTDTLGRVTKNEYNAAGQLVKVTENYLSGQAQNYQNVHNRVTQYTYDNAGRLQDTVDTLGRITRTGYNGENRVAQVTVNYKNGVYDPAAPDEDRIIRYGYDANGNLTDVTDELNRVTHTFYDALNRVGQVIVNYKPGSALPDANLITTYSYDAAGNLQEAINPAGQITRYEYDALNRVVSVTENYVSGAGGTVDRNVITRYSYDGAGNLTGAVDADNHTTTYTYDEINRLKTIRDPLNYLSQYTYDSVGNLTGLTDAQNRTTQYSYDVANRLSGINYPDDTPDVGYSYDAAGRPVTMSDGLPTAAAWQYDAFDRVTSYRDGFNQTLNYQYDILGQRTRLTYPDAKAVNYTWDAAGRLKTVTDWSSQVYRYAWNGAGELTALARPAGLNSAWTYDGAGRLTGLSHRRGSDLLAEYAYILDKSGNRTRLTETWALPANPDPAGPYRVYLPMVMGNGGGGTPALPRHIIDYTYDALNRLTGANYSTGRSLGYTYDAVGNRTGEAVNGQTTTYTYDAANRRNGFTYDANGNLLNDGQRTYAWDAANRLKTVTENGVTTQNDYTGQGDRRRQWVNGAETQYLLDPSGLTQVLAETTGGQTALYLPGLAQYAGNQWVYELPDPLGSVRQLADAGGQILLSQQFDPYGKPLQRVTTGGRQSAFGYTGEQTGPAGLVFLRARYYDPATGRFLSKDPFPGLPAQPATRHPYQYGLNNPARYTDPSGNIPPVFAAAIAGAIMGGVGGGANYAVTHPGEDYFQSQGFWQSVGAGAAGGAVGGAVGAWVGVAGGGFWGAVAGGSVSGGVAGAADQVVRNAFDPCADWYDNVGWATAQGSVIGGVTGGVGYGIGRGLANWSAARDGVSTIAMRGKISSVDDLLNNAGNLERLKGGVKQGFVKGNASEIFTDMAKNYGREIEQNGRELFFKSGDLRVGLHISTKSGESTIHINNMGNLFKIRVTP